MSDQRQQQDLEAKTQGTAFSPKIILGLVALFDASIMGGLGGLIYIAYTGAHQDTFQIYLTAHSLGVFFLLIGFYFSNLYRLEAIIHPERHFLKLIFVILLCFLSLVVLGFALKISAAYSRIWFFSWAGSATIFLYLGRMLCHSILIDMARKGHLNRNIIIVGCTKPAARLLQYVSKNPEPWNNFVGVIDDRSERSGEIFEGLPVLGSVDDLVNIVREHRIDDVILMLPWNAGPHITVIVRKLIELPIDIRLGADIEGFIHPSRSFSFMGGMPLLDIAMKPMEGWSVILKEVEDRVLAALLLILFSPIMIIVALVIKLESRGPVLFRQPRFGFNNQEFGVYKFRSMKHNRPAESGVPQATKGDPRLTRIGGFLRRSSLDELPQLFNVLQGTMSLVGPRPHAVQHNVEYAALIDGYFARHKVKPGITGWAQVNGLRGETDTLDKMKARIEFDLYYIENWSLTLDIKILIMTAFVVFFQKTAY